MMITVLMLRRRFLLYVRCCTRTSHMCRAESCVSMSVMLSTVFRTKINLLNELTKPLHLLHCI